MYSVFQQVKSLENQSGVEIIKVFDVKLHKNLKNKKQNEDSEQIYRN